MLDVLEPLWLRYGRLDYAIACAELRLCLPFAPGTLAKARNRLAHVRSRLN